LRLGCRSSIPTSDTKRHGPPPGPCRATQTAHALRRSPDRCRSRWTGLAGNGLPARSIGCPAREPRCAGAMHAGSDHRGSEMDRGRALHGRAGVSRAHPAGAIRCEAYTTGVHNTNEHSKFSSSFNVEALAGGIRPLRPVFPAKYDFLSAAFANGCVTATNLPAGRFYRQVLHAGRTADRDGGLRK
jgi:hypothetical protein